MKRTLWITVYVLGNAAVLAFLVYALQLRSEQRASLPLVLGPVFLALLNVLFWCLHRRA